MTDKKIETVIFTKTKASFIDTFETIKDAKTFDIKTFKIYIFM